MARLLEGFFMKAILSNHEYTYLYNKGGDALVAVFATLRAFKEKEVYYKEGKEGVCGLLSNKTPLSRNSIKKYLPLLGEFVKVHHNGNIAVLSRKQTLKTLPRQKNTKLIPIECGKLPDTKTSVYYVRVNSNLKKQERQKGKKAKRIETLKAEPKSLKQLKAKTKLDKKTSLVALKNSYRENCTLSNRAFDKLKRQSEYKCPSRGSYQKSKLLKRGLISQQRNVFLFLEGVRCYSYLRELRESLDYGGLFIGNKGIYFEDSPTINIGSALVG